MSAPQKVREPAAVPEREKVDWAESLAKLFAAGTGRIAEAQKKSIDIAAQQNAELTAFWKKAIRATPAASGMFLLELEGSGFDRYVEMQKAAIDLVVEQSIAFAGLVKERATTAATANEEVETFARRSMERVIAVQKKTLDQSAAQAKAVVESSTRQFAENGPVGTMAEVMQRGLDAIVDAQKEFLNIVVH